jgi:quercetin dioxygenase-like cupin family protein
VSSKFSLRGLLRAAEKQSACPIGLISAPECTAAENYHIDFIKADPGNGAALHSHDSEETFICLTGKWRVCWGDNGEEHIDLDYLDGICCPAGVMRSFQNISDSPALMMAIIGGKEPGHVIWAESIRKKMITAHA